MAAGERVEGWRRQYVELLWKPIWYLENHGPPLAARHKNVQARAKLRQTLTFISFILIALS